MSVLRQTGASLKAGISTRSRMLRRFHRANVQIRLTKAWARDSAVSRADVGGLLDDLEALDADQLRVFDDVLAETGTPGVRRMTRMDENDLRLLTGVSFSRATKARYVRQSADLGADAQRRLDELVLREIRTIRVAARGRFCDGPANVRRWPTHHSRPTSSSTRPPPESMPTRHEIPVAAGESVVAVHHEPAADADGAAPEDAWLVCCHGFLSDKTGSYEGRCRRAAAEGYHGVRFDFRGCGEADGAFVDQTLSDKIADLRAVVEHFEPGRLVLFGSSFGGTVAFHAAPDLQDGDDPDLLAVAARAPVTAEGTFADTRAAVEREGSVTVGTDRAVDERFFADLEGYSFEAVAGRLAVPVLVVHGADDDSVPVSDSFEAAAALSTDVLLEKVSGEGHRFSRAAEERLRTRLFDWLASLEAG